MSDQQSYIIGEALGNEAVDILRAYRADGLKRIDFQMVMMRVAEALAEQRAARERDALPWIQWEPGRRLRRKKDRYATTIRCIVSSVGAMSMLEESTNRVMGNAPVGCQLKNMVLEFDPEEWEVLE